MHTLRPLEDTPAIKKPMAMVINRLTDLCEANNICITTTRKQDPNRHKSYPQDIEILV